MNECKVLVVVDMQNDFVSGSLSNEMAQEIVPAIVDKIKGFDGQIILTRDTHYDDYLDTLEGKNLPIPHCISGTEGWCVVPEIREACMGKPYEYLNKPTFGLIDETRWNYAFGNIPTCIEIVGTCTDICVVSNALILKALYPSAKIIVDSKCCAGITKESHNAALLVMAMNQITVK